MRVSKTWGNNTKISQESHNDNTTIWLAEWKVLALTGVESGSSTTATTTTTTCWIYWPSTSGIMPKVIRLISQFFLLFYIRS